MFRGSRSRSSALVIGAVAALLLTGCTPQGGEPRPGPAPEPTSEAPETEPAPDPDPIVFPECDELVSEETVREMLGEPRFELVRDAQQNQQLLEFTLQELFGPAAEGAFRNAEQSAHCVWGVPDSDGLTHLLMAELEDDERDALTFALDDSDYTRTDGPDEIHYFYYVGGVGPNHINHLFRDGLWISQITVSDDPVLGREVLDRLTDGHTAVNG